MATFYPTKSIQVSAIILVSSPPHSDHVLSSKDVSMVHNLTSIWLISLVVITSRVTFIGSELIVMVLTWHKTVKDCNLSWWRSLGLTSRLPSILLRDGAKSEEPRVCSMLIRWRMQVWCAFLSHWSWTEWCLRRIWRCVYLDISFGFQPDCWSRKSGT